MQIPKIKPIADLLKDKKNRLHYIYSKIHLHNEIEAKLKLCLDQRLIGYVQVANVASNKLTLLTPNGAIGTQLRYQVPDILSKLHQETALRHIYYIDVKVSPSFQTDSFTLKRAIPKQKMAKLSEESAAMLNEAANSLSGKLREIMKRIASKVKE